MKTVMNMYNEENYTFEKFITGANNLKAYDAVKNMAECSNTSSKLLHIHGSKGCGKTHLLHAAGNRVREVAEHTNVIAVSAEQFANEFIRLLDQNGLRTFRAHFMSADVLLLDDIGFFEGKETFQNLLAETIEELLHKGARIVLTSNVPVTEFTDIQNGVLKELLLNADSTKIEEADLDMRVKILERLIEDNDVLVTDSIKAVAVFVANMITVDTAELIAAMQRVLTLADLMGTDITLDFAERILTERSFGDRD